MNGPVLLVLDGADAAPHIAVSRAHALSIIVADALHIVQVVVATESAHLSADLVLFEAERDLRRVCRAELPDALGADRLSVRSGELVAEALAAVARTGAGLVVLGASPKAASRAAELAARAAIPVLVARAPRPLGSIVAATDLDHPGYPVVQLVARLRARLEAPVALLHNVAPVDPFLPGPTPTDQHLAFSTRSQHLREVAAEFLPGAELLTLELGSAATAILEAGARADCDLIVVGVPTATKSAVDIGVAEDVVRRATRSVLVAPLA